MAFGRSETIYVKNGEDILAYNCSIKYMTIRFKDFFPNIIENDVKNICTDGMGVLDSFVLDGIVNQYKKMKKE